MGSNVYLTPLYRAAWADMMAVDARLSPVAVRVGIIIGGYFNSGSASTYVGQKTIAKNMGISARTVWEAVRELITHGYLISTSGGRNSNTYFMPVEKVATYCDIYLKKSRNGLRSLSQETSQNSAEISQNRVLNIATGCEQTPILTPFNSKARGTASPDWRQSVLTMVRQKQATALPASNRLRTNGNAYELNSHGRSAATSIGLGSRTCRFYGYLKANA